MKQHLKPFGLITGLAVSLSMTLFSVLPWQSVAQAEEHIPTLKELRSFEVESYSDIFAPDSVRVAPELIQQTGFVLNQERRIPKASPAEGLVKLTCIKWPECNQIKMSVLYRPTGQEVWSTTIKSYRFFVTWWFDSIPRQNGDMAKDLIQQLTTAYTSPQ